VVEIGERPILWHIMKLYTQYGFWGFVVCLGHKGRREAGHSPRGSTRGGS